VKRTEGNGQPKRSCEANVQYSRLRKQGYAALVVQGNFAACQGPWRVFQELFKNSKWQEQSFPNPKPKSKGPQCPTLTRMISEPCLGLGRPQPPQAPPARMRLWRDYSTSPRTSFTTFKLITRWSRSTRPNFPLRSANMTPTVRVGAADREITISIAPLTC